MDNNPIFTEKAKHYNIFREVNFILNSNLVLTKELILKIIELAYESNKKGKRRQMSKSEYIKLINSIYS